VQAQAQAQQQQQQQQIQQQIQQMQAAAAGGAYGDGGWANNPFVNQQQPDQESAYQRLPVNNRRRNLKRERPSDFLEVGEEKVQRYWE